jgi:hypothetical protein
MTDLGDLYSIHKPANADRLLYLYFGIGCFLLTLVIIVIVVDAQLNLKENNSKNYLLLIAVAALPAGVYLLKWYRRWTTEEVRVFNHGIVYSVGKEVHIIKPDEIETLLKCGVRRFHYGREVGVFVNYTIKLTDGKLFNLGPPLEDTDGLGDRLEEWLFKYRFPHIIEKLNQGESVKFGEFEIDASRLLFRNQPLPFSKLGKTEVSGGEIIICGNDNGRTWVKTDYVSVPNASILVFILKELNDKRP